MAGRGGAYTGLGGGGGVGAEWMPEFDKGGGTLNAVGGGGGGGGAGGGTEGEVFLGGDAGGTGESLGGGGGAGGGGPGAAAT